MLSSTNVKVLDGVEVKFSIDPKSGLGYPAATQVDAVLACQIERLHLVDADGVVLQEVREEKSSALIDGPRGDDPSFVPQGLVKTAEITKYEV